MSEKPRPVFYCKLCRMRVHEEMEKHVERMHRIYMYSENVSELFEEVSV